MGSRSTSLGRSHSTTYTGSIDDRLLGTFSLKSFQPYLGIGIGNPVGKRIGINFDAGVGLGSRPTVELTAEGPLNDDPIIGPIFRDDLERQEAVCFRGKYSRRTPVLPRTLYLYLYLHLYRSVEG